MHVGITGHQHLESIEWITAEMSSVLRSVPTLVGLSSLAPGADQLFAELVLGAGGELMAILPFPDYAAELPDLDAKQSFEVLQRRARHIVTLQRRPARERSFLEAGRYIVSNSDLIVAVWDGEPARSVGGIGDVVAIAVAQGRPIIHLDPTTCTRRDIRPRP